MGSARGRRWWVFRAVLSLTLGISATFGIAWGFAAWEQRKGGTFPDWAASADWRTRKQYTIRAPIPTLGVLGAWLGPAKTVEYLTKAGTELLVDEPWYNLRQEWRFGWPRPCMTFRRVSTDQVRIAALSAQSPTPEPSLPVQWSGQVVAFLPLKIAGRAFAMDVGVWTLVFSTWLLGVPAVRNVVRRRRGLCTDCGYDRRSLGTQTPCPECGYVAAR